MSQDIIKAFKVASLQAVLSPDAEYFFRSLCRWYSEKFHTPLDRVYELPVDFILTHYYESYYEQLDPTKRSKEAVELLETPEERAERLRKEELNLGIEYATAIAAAKKLNKSNKKPTLSDAVKVGDVSQISKVVEEAMEKSRRFLDEVKADTDPNEFSLIGFNDADPLSKPK